MMPLLMPLLPAAVIAWAARPAPSTVHMDLDAASDSVPTAAERCLGLGGGRRAARAHVIRISPRARSPADCL